MTRARDAGAEIDKAVTVHSSAEGVTVAGVLTGVRIHEDRIDVSSARDGRYQWLPGRTEVYLLFGSVVVRCRPDDEVTLT